MLLEIQQSSDLTYRVYDYDRLSDGKTRDLHLDKAIDVIDTPSKHMEVVSSTIENPIQDLIDSAYYSVFKIDITDSFTILQKSPFLLVSVIDGQGFVNGEAIEKGEFFIVPYGEKEYEFSGDLKIVIAAAK
jgi:beta-glucosidase